MGPAALAPAAPSLVPPVQDPPAGVDYTQVFTGPDHAPVRSIVGVLLGTSLYVLLAQLVAQACVAVGWMVAGRPGSFHSYLVDSLAFRHPAGLVGAHLGLAMLIPLTLALVRWLHGRAPRWSASVQPGMRWRYLLLMVPVAAVVLNAMVLLGRIGTPWRPDPQRDVWLWLVLVLLTSPLQAAGEEFFFRGYLMQAFGSLVGDERGAVGRWFGVVASALVFALFHGVQNLPLFVDRFGFGLLAGALVLLTGGLEAGIACHVANNLFAFGWAAFFGGIANVRALQVITWASAASDLAGFAIFAALALLVAGRLRLATRTPGGSTAGFGVPRAVH